MVDDAKTPRNPPGSLAILVALFVLAVGFAARDLLGPPLLAAFLAWLLLPYRSQPWVLRLLAILAVVVALWIIDRFGGLLLIVGIAFFLAYLLDSPVDFLERKLPRSLAVLCLLVPVTAALVATAILVVPPLVHQVGQLVGALPELAARVQDAVLSIAERSRLEPLARRYEDFLPRIVEFAQQLATRALSSVLDVTRAVGTAIAAAVLVPILTFYLLRDYDRLRDRGTELVPRRYHGWLEATTAEVDRLLGRWLRGAATVALIVGVLTGAGLYVLGVPYALLLGALAGLLNVVPVVGFWVSFLAAALTGLAAGGWAMLLHVSILYVGISLLEGQVLSPRIVGEAIGLHPVLMLVALAVFADLLGILGAVVAVPLTILAVILGRQLRTLYLASDLYGAPTAPPAEPPVDGD